MKTKKLGLTLLVVGVLAALLVSANPTFLMGSVYTNSRLAKRIDAMCSSNKDGKSDANKARKVSRYFVSVVASDVPTRESSLVTTRVSSEVSSEVSSRGGTTSVASEVSSEVGSEVTSETSSRVSSRVANDKRIEKYCKRYEQKKRSKSKRYRR